MMDAFAKFMLGFGPCVPAIIYPWWRTRKNRQPT